MFNNDDPTVTVCCNRKHSFPVKDYIVMASRTIADLFRRIVSGSRIHFFNTACLSLRERIISKKFDKIDNLYKFDSKILGNDTRRFWKFEYLRNTLVNTAIIFQKESLGGRNYDLAPIGHTNLS